MFEFLLGLGVIGGIILILLIPLIVTIIVGIAIANMLGFTGMVWWAFVILFYLIISSLLSLGAK